MFFFNWDDKPQIISLAVCFGLYINVLYQNNRSKNGATLGP